MRVTKVLSIIVGLSMLIFLSSCSSNLEPTDEAYFEFDKEKGSIVGYLDHAPKDIVIPSEVEGIRVKRIEHNAFAGMELESVVIPEGVIMIGYSSFANNNLIKVDLPESVLSVGGESFRNNEIKNLKLPKNLTIIGDSAFYSNELESVEFPENIEIIKSGSFGKNKLKNLDIPKKVYSINAGAFIENPIENVKVYRDVLIDKSLDSEGEKLEYDEYMEIAKQKNQIYISARAFETNQERTEDIDKIKHDFEKIGILNK